MVNKDIMHMTQIIIKTFLRKKLRIILKKLRIILEL